MSYTDILYEKNSGIAKITINRPEVLNVFRWETLDDLITAFTDADNDPTIGVVVITGAGDKAFCVGGDAEAMKDLEGKTGAKWNKKLLTLSTLMRTIDIPIIAAINGYCIGGGNEINVFCDLTIASERAKLGQAGTKVGAAPIWGCTQLLPRIVGEKKAREMVYMSNLYTAEEAEKMGLVNKVVPHEQLAEEVQKWCERILEMSPQSIRIAKVSLNFESDLLTPSFNHAAALLNSLWGSEQLKEGLKALKEKRKPEFGRFRQ
ncbi:MAG: hypothetical protein APF81_17615 [Desulfosporosinus sp. BRH_c37]|nr:MAG: hypothetical protein APF81_17615 [Desulfosporosinus sp. BRH_c37]